MYAVSPNQIANWPLDEKALVRDLVSVGIKNGVVRCPVERAVGSDTPTSVSKIQNLASQWQRGNQFVVKSDATYVVIGKSY